MKNRVNRIEILNEQNFDELIQTHYFEKFVCVCDGRSVADNIMRIAIYSNYDMFDELAEQLSNSDSGYRMYGGTIKKQNYLILEIY